ncbi:hypothetical protein EMCG_09603 [[Emmonsia] crescens]|uniref:Uncharacterized protein n=1 Tax=[Emmonsia] crescens TaxID=73230 RepID=A0A0G2I2P3_9EURO|nr:hypothetical protein EMCG_09603 [Emmonsia crescens UAMH 3008]
MGNERSEKRGCSSIPSEGSPQKEIGRDQVLPSFWAFCQVSDVSKREAVVSILELVRSTKMARLCAQPTKIKSCESMIYLDGYNT